MDLYYKSPKNGCSDKEFLVDNFKTRTKSMAEIYNSPEFESEKLIDELEQLKRTNLTNEKRMQIIEKRMYEIKSNNPVYKYKLIGVVNMLHSKLRITLL